MECKPGDWRSNARANYIPTTKFDLRRIPPLFTLQREKKPPDICRGPNPTSNYASVVQTVRNYLPGTRQHRRMAVAENALAPRFRNTQEVSPLSTR